MTNKAGATANNSEAFLNKSSTTLRWIDSAEQVIRGRRSTRGFSSTPTRPEHHEALMAALSTGRNPFRATHRFKIVSSDGANGSAKGDSAKNDGAKLGTYGVIKGAKDYLISALTPGEDSLEALGFDMEYAVLEAQALGLGTCWLGGTFNKGQFATALGLQPGELLPIVIPFGQPAEKDGLVGRLIRNVAGSNQRMDFGALFSNEAYGTPLTQAEAGPFSTALEMVRLGPSASNKQPWRAVKEGNALHFYLKPTKGYSNSLGYDIQRVDMGIALCHFDVMAQAQGLQGHFVKRADRLAKQNASEAEKRDDLSYIISFVIQ